MYVYMYIYMCVCVLKCMHDVHEAMSAEVF